MSLIDKNLMKISIHTLHTEGDREANRERVAAQKFQSTPSTRRVTDGLIKIRDSYYGFQSTPSTRRVTVFVG